MRVTFALVVFSSVLCSAASAQELAGFATLPADTFRDGPTSGQFIKPGEYNGVTPPFENKQPVQGISSVIAGDEQGTYLALSDNGFGTKANSADYLLCTYKITPDWAKHTVAWELAFEFSDPDRHVPWPIVADGETYPNSDIPVPQVIREQRLLTGADFDVESMVRLPDGTFWLGDEFGPFLLHFSKDGKLLEPPVELPGEGMHSPDHPTKDPATAKIGRSAGFGALFGIKVGARLELGGILEKPIASERDLLPILGWSSDMTFDGAFPYPLPDNVAAIGEAHAVMLPPDNDNEFDLLTVERDDGEADNAVVKRLAILYFATNLPDFNRNGGPFRHAVIADLLDLGDPHDLNGDGKDRFRFPFLTIESVLPVDERTVLVCNDNNYPFTNGRGTDGGGDPDATEFILVRFDTPLAELGNTEK